MKLLLAWTGLYLAVFAYLTGGNRRSEINLTESIRYFYDAYRKRGRGTSTAILLSLWYNLGELQPLALLDQQRSLAAASPKASSAHGTFMAFCLFGLGAVGLAGLVALTLFMVLL